MGPATPKYPAIHVELRGHNPLVMVSRVRWALWRKGIATTEIEDFSRRALGSRSPREIERECAAWVDVETSDD